MFSRPREARTSQTVCEESVSRHPLGLSLLDNSSARASGVLTPVDDPHCPVAGEGKLVECAIVAYAAAFAESR